VGREKGESSPRLICRKKKKENRRFTKIVRPGGRRGSTPGGEKKDGLSCRSLLRTGGKGDRNPHCAKEKRRAFSILTAGEKGIKKKKKRKCLIPVEGGRKYPHAPSRRREEEGGGCHPVLGKGGGKERETQHT